MIETISGKLIYDLVMAIFFGAIVGGLLLELLKAKWSEIQNFFSKELQRQATQITGTWDVAEEYSKFGENAIFTFEIKCVGGQITGIATCLTGVAEDIGKSFTLKGIFKNQILTIVWAKIDPYALEAGSITAKLIREKELEGYCLYIEPDDGKVYTAKLSGRLR